MKFEPRVSFTIPTLNRERTLGACLKSIADQDYPHIEIIIVDGGSKDSTLDIASKFPSKIIHNDGTLGEARQVGFECSTGDIIAVFDSDIVIPHENWLFNAVQKFKEGKRIGIVRPDNRAPAYASATSRCYFALWEAHTSVFRESKRKAATHVPGGNTLILREAIERAGGFRKDLRFGEDVELCGRIMKLGYETVFFDQPLIHDTMWSLGEYTRKQIWGASALAEAEDANIVNLSLSWSEMPGKVSSGRLVTNAVSLIMTGFRGMIEGLGKKKEVYWLMFPLLMTIRIMVYGAFFLVKADL